MDNHFLKSELKVGDSEVEMIRARWKYGLVLIDLALLRDDEESKRVDDNNSDYEDENSDSIDKRVEHFTRAIAPVLCLNDQLARSAGNRRGGCWGCIRRSDVNPYFKIRVLLATKVEDFPGLLPQNGGY